MEDLGYSFTREGSLLVGDFRRLKHGFGFVLHNQQGGQVVGVTFITSGEGNAFVAANLAGAFALASKGVVVIGVDLRKPKLNDYFTLPSGLDRYSYGKGYYENLT